MSMGFIMNKMLKIMLIVTLSLGLLINGCSAGSSSSELPTAAVGQTAPDFKLQNLDGESISLSDFQDKPVLINFWATWCGPCAFEMPFLQQIYEEWSDKGLVVLTINIGESLAKVEEFMKSRNLSLPVLLDTKTALAHKYGITGIPTTFFIDKNGIIQEKLIGAFPSKAAIEKRLSKIID